MNEKKTRILIGSLATLLVAAILTAVGLGVQSVSRGRDLEANATALQENTDSLVKAQDALTVAQEQVDALGAELEDTKANSDKLIGEKDLALTQSAEQLDAEKTNSTELEAKLKDAQTQLDAAPKEC